MDRPDHRGPSMIRMWGFVLSAVRNSWGLFVDDNIGEVAGTLR